MLMAQMGQAKLPRRKSLIFSSLRLWRRGLQDCSRFQSEKVCSFGRQFEFLGEGVALQPNTLPKHFLQSLPSYLTTTAQKILSLYVIWLKAFITMNDRHGIPRGRPERSLTLCFRCWYPWPPRSLPLTRTPKASQKVYAAVAQF